MYSQYINLDLNVTSQPELTLSDIEVKIIKDTNNSLHILLKGDGMHTTHDVIYVCLCCVYFVKLIY